MKKPIRVEFYDDASKSVVLRQQMTLEEVNKMNTCAKVCIHDVNYSKKGSILGEASDGAALHTVIVERVTK